MSATVCDVGDGDGDDRSFFHVCFELVFFPVTISPPAQSWRVRWYVIECRTVDCMKMRPGVVYVKRAESVRMKTNPD